MKIMRHVEELLINGNNLNNMRRFFSIIILLVICVTAVAETSFIIIPPRQVIEGNKFNVTFRLKDGDGSGLKAPEIEGCTLLYGPSTSTMQSYQMINGQTTSSTTIDYSYIYRADKAGTYTIASASISVNGKSYTTKETTFTILPADKATQGNQSNVRVDDYSTQSTDKQVSENDVFVRIILSKSKAYEQEAIECTIKLYTKYSISSFMSTTQPSFDGFLIEELDLKSSLNQIENYKGQNYMTAILKKCIIFPQKSGKLTINSGKYDITVVQYERVNLGFFSDTRPIEKKIKVSSNSATVNIDPLPLPQPDGFYGAVGKFSIDSKLQGTSFRTNEASSLIYTIKGTGNIKYVREPIIDFPTEFEQYTPKNEIKAAVSGNNVTGSMTIEYTFVPQSVGKFTIGTDKFVYFDPSSKKYITLSTPTYDINVSKGVSTQTTTAVNQKDIATKNTDILHIKLGDKKLQKIHSYYSFSLWYWALYIIGIILLVAIIYFNLKRIKANADVKGTRLAKANKVAKKRLKQAKLYIDSHETDKFYDEILRATWGYISDKLSIPASQLNRDNISSELTTYGATEKLINDIIGVLDECEMARYTPEKTNEQIENLYNTISYSMNEMENIKTK